MMIKKEAVIYNSLFFSKKNKMIQHPLQQFSFCPKCGSSDFTINNEKSKKCQHCGFIYYLNPSAAVACFIRNKNGNLLLAYRAKEPAQGMLDLPGGFVDLNETAEEAIKREILEETGLQLNNIKYLFSIPNVYFYSNFNVHTLDLFYEAIIENMDDAVAADDVLSLHIQSIKKLDPESFGLHSIKKAIIRYKEEEEEEIIH